MSTRTALVWDRRFLSYDFGPEHPLRPVRVELAVELSRTYGLLDHPDLIVREAREASSEELGLVHTPAYIEAVERISRSASDPFGPYGWGIGTGDVPAFQGIHEASAVVAGGALVASDLLQTGECEHVFHPAGGLHHAMPDAASGFCVYNDPAIAIARLLEHGVERVAYVDVDVHHGDGVQHAFYTDPRVLTVSLHESGRYLFPGTGFPDEIGSGDGVGTSVNVALPPATGHDPYLESFDAVVPPLVEAFRPQVLVTQLGCDTHVTDPLAHLALEMRTYGELAIRLHDLAHSAAGGRWLATGGGGYQLFAVVPRAWTLYFARLIGADLSNDLPAEWLELARDRGGTRLPEVLVDPPLDLPDAQGEAVRDGARVAAMETMRVVGPYHSLR